MTPRPLRLPDEEKALRELVRLCEPREAHRPSDYYFVHPTLVVEVQGRLVGYTVFTVAPNPATGQAMVYGKGHGVHPDWRGKGVNKKLADARLVMARQAGATTFVGMTRADNAPMRKTFESQGLHLCQTIPRHYGDVDGVIYAGPVR